MLHCATLKHEVIVDIAVNNWLPESDDQKHKEQFLSLRLKTADQNKTNSWTQQSAVKALLATEYYDEISLYENE